MTAVTSPARIAAPTRTSGPLVTAGTIAVRTGLQVLRSPQALGFAHGLTCCVAGSLLRAAGLAVVFAPLALHAYRKE